MNKFLKDTFIIVIKKLKNIKNENRENQSYLHLFRYYSLKLAYMSRPLMW